MDDVILKRKHPRLPAYHYDKNGEYFITICSDGRKNIFGTVGRGLAPADKVIVTLSIYGNIIKEEIEKIHKRYSCAKISNYIIMPDHIHLILVMRYGEEYAAGASPRPTVMDIICALKSIITRRCKAIGYINKRLFQTSFYEHIIRNKNDFDEIVYYIKSNPERRCKKQAAKENRNDR